jgi:hypothetical protein
MDQAMSTKNEPGKVVSTAATKAGESTKPEPYLSDEQFDAMLVAASGQWTKIKAHGPASMVCRQIRDCYEEELQRLLSEVERLRELAQVACDNCQSIVEYWNKDRNDSAMHDACWHNVNTASETLEKFAENGITPSK